MRIRPNQLPYVLGDVLMVVLAGVSTLVLRYDSDPFGRYPPSFCIAACAAISAIIVGAGILLHSYRSLWIHMGLSDLFRQAAIIASVSAAVATLKLLLFPELMFQDIVLFSVILFLLTAGIRSLPRCMRWLSASRRAQRGQARRAVIIGAGAAGAMIVKRLLGNPSDGIRPVAILDDDEAKQGTRISGVGVRGKIRDVRAAVEKYRSDEIIIAIPSASPGLLDRIRAHCLEAAVPVRIFQSVVDCRSFIEGNRKALSEVSIEELLTRDSIKHDMSAACGYLQGKTVLVTGGAGSIGSELCRQILRSGCLRLIIFDISENGLFALDEDLRGSFGDSRYELCIGSIQDERRLEQVFGASRPDVVFHAAAHKHVPMMELNPSEAIKNNIFGTRNVINCCIKHGTSRFIFISTDKAVRPTSVMGATKRAAELLVQQMNGLGGCEMAAVRFGNVLGSNGSVVPIFRKQIAEGGPVTVTHRDIRRYFMTIGEAVSLVLLAGSQARGGEIFVLDMGRQVRIYDLACNMIRLAGFEPNRDIPIEITGLRPGEKLYEELSLETERVEKTELDKIYVIREGAHPSPGFVSGLEILARSVRFDASREEIYKLLFAIVSADDRGDMHTDRGVAGIVHAV
jgi:FlaA1/EpsC-like NDP-sugar epimerase